MQLEFNFEPGGVQDQEIVRRLREQKYRREYYQRNKAKWQTKYQANKEQKLAAGKEWRKNNPEKTKAGRRRWREEHSEHYRQYQRDYYAKNTQKVIDLQAKWRLQNPEKAAATRRVRYTNALIKRRLNPDLRIVDSLRQRVRRALKGPGIKKSRRTLLLIGCTAEHLKKHLQEQFTQGMTWENYGRCWVIDHRIPCASFNLTDSRQQQLCFHWSNLQPLLCIVNLRKGKKIIQEHQFPLLWD